MELKYINKIAKFIFYTSGTITGVFSTGTMMDYLKFSDKQKNQVFKRYLDNWGEKSLSDVKLKVVLEDETVFEDKENYLFLSNHRSFADVLAIFATAPQSLRFVAKKSIFKIPIFAHAMRYIGVFEIDRDDSKKAIKTLKKVKKRLKKGNDSIVMFPEGTRNRISGLLPFKKGAFHLAIDAGVPIIPVTLVNTDQVLPVGSWRMYDGEITLYYGKPISTKGLTKEDIPKLMEEVREAILKHL